MDECPKLKVSEAIALAISNLLLEGKTSKENLLILVDTYYKAKELNK